MAPEEEKASREEHCSSSSSLFQLPLDPELWVLPEKTSTPAPGSAGQRRPAEEEEEEEDKWLLKKRSQAQVCSQLHVIFCFNTVSFSSLL